ncbi:MAG TPA: hypothetical protein VF796_26420 [Humisphaera sp.]
MARPYAYTPRRRLVLQGVMVLLFGGTMLAAHGLASRRPGERPAVDDGGFVLNRRAIGDGLDYVKFPAPPPGWIGQRAADGTVGYVNPTRTSAGMRSIRATVRDRRADLILTPELALAELVPTGTDPRAYRTVSAAGVSWRMATVRQTAPAPGTEVLLTDDPTVGGRIIACAVPLPGVVVTVELQVVGRAPTDADQSYVEYQILGRTRFASEQ